jgi:hypothetical protein
MGFNPFHQNSLSMLGLKPLGFVDILDHDLKVVAIPTTKSSSDTLPVIGTRRNG